MINNLNKLKNLILGVIFTFYEKLLGPRIFVEITPTSSDLETISVTTLEGSITTIHCQEKRYICRYKRWYVRNNTVCIYYVFATVEGTILEKLIDACKMECYFPKLLHSRVPSSSQRKAAVEAYLDILLDKLQGKNSNSINYTQ